MIADLDFSGATLEMGPELVRDGGSIIIHVKVNDITLIVRYAAGFADALSGDEGKLELQTCGTDPVQPVLVEASDLIGWHDFIKANQIKLRPHETKFLGEFEVPQQKKAAIIEAFTRKK